MSEQRESTEIREGFLICRKLRVKRPSSSGRSQGGIVAAQLRGELPLTLRCNIGARAEHSKAAPVFDLSFMESTGTLNLTVPVD